MFTSVQHAWHEHFYNSQKGNQIQTVLGLHSPAAILKRKLQLKALIATWQP